MIYLYSGTPGSGKSFHAMKEIFRWNKKGKTVITNFECNLDILQLQNSQITVDFLKDFAIKNHVPRVESQTLIVIDESQLLFNSRDWNSCKDSRMKWIEFFSQHRKFGYTIILIAQFDRMIDRQIRSLIEYEVKHKKMNNFFKFIPFTTFLCINKWYGSNMKLNHETILYNKKIADLYDTFSNYTTQSTENIESR